MGDGGTMSADLIWHLPCRDYGFLRFLESNCCRRFGLDTVLQQQLE